MFKKAKELKTKNELLLGDSSVAIYVFLEFIFIKPGFVQFH